MENLTTIDITNIIERIKNLPITKDNIRNHYTFRPFIFDTETTGFHGCTVFHKNHQILQIACIDVCSSDEFDQYIDNPDAIITDQSSATHGITDDIIKSNDAKPPHTVLKMFLQWVYERAGDKEVIFFAHNALFDFFMLLKTLPVDCGKEGVYLNFRVVDTLELVKHFYPDIKWNAFLPTYQDKVCKGRPHCLPALSKYFFGGTYENLHDAIVDCRELEKIVMTFILPHIVTDLHHEKGRHLVKGLIKPRDLIEPSTPSMMTRLKDVKYIRGFVRQFLSYVNETYAKHGMQHMTTTDNLISVFDVYNYGYLTALHSELKPQHDDIWYSIILHIEILMRGFIHIYTDDIHCELFSLMTNRTILEFALNTTIRGTDIPIYPSLVGHPISYLPFDFSEETAMKMYNVFGIRTSHELYLNFYFSKTTMKKWVNSVLAKLNMDANDAFSEERCEEYFKLIVKKFD